MRTTWFAAAFLASTVLVGHTYAQVADDAKALLNESSKVINSTSGVTFKARKYATGMLKDIVDMDSQVKLMRSGTTTTWMVQGRVKQPGKPDKKLVIVSDGSTVKWLDEEKATYFERPATDQITSEPVQLAKQMLLSDWFEGKPYEKELAMPFLSKKPGDKVGDTVCDVVEGMLSNKQRASTWWIGAADKLPRRQEWSTGEVAAGPDRVTMVTEFTDVKLANLTAADFKIELPTGFVKDLQESKPAPAPAQTSATPAPAPKVELGLKPGTPAPAISATDSSGAKVNLADHKGKAVVIEFWGTMFKRSTTNAADMKALAADFAGKNVSMLGVACRELNPKKAATWWSEQKLPYSLITAGDAIAADYKVAGFPSYYVIGADGNVSTFFQDFPGKDKLKAAIETAMSAK